MTRTITIENAVGDIMVTLDVDGAVRVTGMPDDWAVIDDGDEKHARTIHR